MPRAATTFSPPFAIAILATIAGVAPSALAQSFTLMGTLPTYTISQNTGLSADGLVAAGYHGGGGLVPPDSCGPPQAATELSAQTYVPGKSQR